jgi:DNA-binding MarR family transcriptional regulator
MTPPHHPPFDADAGFLLARASGLVVQATNAQLMPLGLRVRHYTVLKIACSGAALQRDVIRIMGLDPSQAVALVDELEETGLVRREVDATDRRQRRIIATDEGSALYTRAERAVDQALESSLRTLTHDERAALMTGLHRLVFAEPPSEDRSEEDRA